MSGSNIHMMQRHLRRMLETDRSDAITYTVLTVLATPVFVAVP